MALDDHWRDGNSVMKWEIDVDDKNTGRNCGGIKPGTRWRSRVSFMLSFYSSDLQRKKICHRKKTLTNTNTRFVRSKEDRNYEIQTEFSVLGKWPRPCCHSNRSLRRRRMTMGCSRCRMRTHPHRRRLELFKLNNHAWDKTQKLTELYFWASLSMRDKR